MPMEDFKPDPIPLHQHLYELERFFVDERRTAHYRNQQARASKCSCLLQSVQALRDHIDANKTYVWPDSTQPAERFDG